MLRTNQKDEHAHATFWLMMQQTLYSIIIYFTVTETDILMSPDLPVLHVYNTGRQTSFNLRGYPNHPPHLTRPVIWSVL